MSRARVRSAAAGLAALLALGGCSGSLFQSKVPPPTTYLLSPALSAASAPAPQHPLPVDLAVLKPRVRAGLESDRIAALYPDRRLDYYADARWSGPLAETLQDAAVQMLHERAHLRGVSGDASVFASAYWLELEVTDFEAEYSAGSDAPTVHVRLLARIGGSADRAILGRFVVEARQPAAANRLTAIVQAFAQAAGAALGDVAAHADAMLGSAGTASSPQ